MQHLFRPFELSEPDEDLSERGERDGKPASRPYFFLQRGAALRQCQRLLVTGDSVGPVTALVACVMLGALCASLELVYRSPAEEQQQPEATGPSTLGPGFALRR